MRIALGLEYDGAPFHGWQSQADGSGVQDALERALAAIAGAPVARDRGGPHRCRRARDAAGRALRHRRSAAPTPPGCAASTRCCPTRSPCAGRCAVPADFHARFAATGRHYTYLLLDRPVRPGAPRGRASAGTIGRSRSTRCEPRAEALVGKHDFSAFRAAECQAKSPVKTLDRVDIAREDDMIRFDLHADAFLQHMVRNIVGALVYVGSGRAAAGVDRANCWRGATARAGRRRSRRPGSTSPASTIRARWNLPATRRAACSVPRC